LVIFATSLLLIAGFGTTAALADESPEQLYGVRPTAEDSEEAMKEGPALELPTNLGAAEEMPHKNLDRGEVADLLGSVFGAELEGAAGPFAELEVDRFLSDNVAVVDPGTLSASGEAGDSNGPVLLESSIPLRAEDASGEERPLALGLEQAEGELQPQNPLVEVGVPTELGEGIELPEAGIGISLPDTSDERAPSTVSQTTALYPNIAEDSDLIVAPTPTGVETFQQLRSPEAPQTQAYDLKVPSGASVKETKDGGAEVAQGEEKLITVPPPTAIDAAGSNVATHLEVSGTSISVTVSPDSTAAYPILVDPLFETFNWPAYEHPGGSEVWYPFEGWIKASNTPYAETFEYEMMGPTSRPGLYIEAHSGIQSPGQGNWNYYVPRMSSDYTKYGVRPTTYINGATLQQLEFKFWAGYYGVNRQAAPYFQGGIWDSINGGWISVASRNGVEGQLLDPSYPYPFENKGHSPNGKNFGVALLGLEPFTEEWAVRTLYVGIASIELTDGDAPSLGTEVPSKWVNQQPTVPIAFSTTDPGLGVYKITIEETTTGGGKKLVETKQGCVGGVYRPCPRNWANSEPGQPTLSYDPSVMPTGEDWVKISAYDPIGHNSAETQQRPLEALIKVDHTSPSLALTGPITEQGSLGTARPSYELEINSKDGTAEAPQSGVAKTAIEIDGKVVNESAPGCTTQNCSVSRKWTLESSKYSTGSHVLKVASTDAVGNAVTKSQSFKLQPAAPPSVELAGTATQQATLGTSRPRYMLKVNATTNAGFNGMPMAAPTYASFAGSPGTGKGQFGAAMGSAVDSKGNLWVVDWGNGRVEEFNTKGEYLGQFGEPGSNPGQLKKPLGLAIDATGNFWVTCEDGRIEKFGPDGKFIRQFGGEGTADGTFKEPGDIAIDSKGNLWIADTSNNRIQKLSPEGKFLGKFGKSGSGNGEFQHPRGITITPEGSIWIADTWNNRIQKFSPEGSFLASYGEPGTGNGNITLPVGIRSDQAGNLYVSEAAGRVQVFNSADEYLTQFGSAGKGPGQFSYPSYIALDPAGNIWVDDADSEVQRWRAPVPPPTFSLSFGSKGTGAGQFTTPSGITIDSAGNVWVVDRANGRIEKFNAKGEFQSQFGTKGSGAGQLSSPWGIAIDPSGNVWVTDTTNVRVVEFNAKGEFVATFGTNVNKTKVEAGGTQAEKNLCTAASKNVCQAGTAGSAEGQMKEPTGIATSSGGNLYVVEKGNGRVEKFSPTGEKLAKFGGPGSGNGQFSGPTGIAVAPDGSLWVADTGNSRIEQWTSAFEPVKSVGKAGGGNGQFLEPYGLSIDSKGNVWVADTWSNRIQEFNSDGDFLSKFGKSGSEEGQLTSPYSVAPDSTGNLWIAETSRNQIQKWIPPTSRASTITTEISVDGTPVNTKVGRCGTETCAVAPEWTLEAGAYPGKHTILVKATDGLGRSTTKTLAVESQKDTVKPTVEASGALASAPEGWVEQKSYTLTANATDGGYGIKSLSTFIDGAVVTSSGAPCPDGGCPATISKVIDTNAYSGGAHKVEITATDWADNSTTKSWTLNVDPKGTVGTQEATATLEAVEDTSFANPIGPAIGEDEYEGTQPGLGVEQSGNTIAVTGNAAPTSVSTEAKGGFTIEVPSSVEVGCGKVSEQGIEHELSGAEEEAIPAGASDACSGEGASGSTIEVSPVGVSAGAGKAVIAPEETATVVPNIQTGVDMITRPLFDGALDFENIRDASGPETYSWQVHLGVGQILVKEDAQHATVEYSGHAMMGITAVPAHDAVGTSVPTSLNVTQPDIVTLTVAHHSKGFVYPIIAGTGWEGGFQTFIVAMPPKEPLPGEEPEEEEEALFEDSPDGSTQLSLLTFGPPVLTTGGIPQAASSTAVQAKHRAYNFDYCNWTSGVGGTYPSDKQRVLRAQASQQCHGQIEGPQGEIKEGPAWAMSMSGVFHYKYGHWVWINEKPVCRKWGPKKPALVHCPTMPTVSSSHIDVVGDYRFPIGVFSGPGESTCFELDGVLPIRPVYIPGEPVLHGRLHHRYTYELPGDACPWGNFPPNSPGN
jgi:sugar lactone lactonase YvrE